MPSPAAIFRKLASLLGATAFLMFAVFAPASATISTTTSTVTAAGNSVTTAFNYPFLMSSASYAVVQIVNTNVTPNTVTTLSSTQYSITGVTNPTGGTVTYPLSGSPLAPGYYIVISRVVPLIQTTSISNQGPTFRAIENALDYLTEITQQLQAQITVLQAQASGGTVPEPIGRFVTAGVTDNASSADTTIVWASASSGDKTENLYACNSSVAWRTLSIVDQTGTFQIYPLTVTPNGSDTINLASTFLLPFNSQSATLLCNGAGNWLPL